MKKLKEMSKMQKLVLLGILVFEIALLFGELFGNLSFATPHRQTLENFSITEGNTTTTVQGYRFSQNDLWYLNSNGKFFCMQAGKHLDRTKEGWKDKDGDGNMDLGASMEDKIYTITESPALNEIVAYAIYNNNDNAHKQMFFWSNDSDYYKKDSTVKKNNLSDPVVDDMTPKHATWLGYSGNRSAVAAEWNRCLDEAIEYINERDNVIGAFNVTQIGNQNIYYQKQKQINNGRWNNLTGASDYHSYDKNSEGVEPGGSFTFDLGVDITNSKLITYTIENATITQTGNTCTVTVDSGTSTLGGNEVSITFDLKQYNTYSGTYDHYQCDDQQDLANIEVGKGSVDYRIFIKVPIEVNVEVKNYIEKILDKNGNDQCSESGKVEEHDNVHNQLNKETRTFGNTNKQNYPAVAEVGDTIVYRVEVTNNSNALVFVDLKDVLPDNVTVTNITRQVNEELVSNYKGNTIQGTNWPAVKENGRILVQIHSYTDRSNAIAGTSVFHIYATVNSVNNYQSCVSTASIEGVYTKIKDESANGGNGSKGPELINTGSPKSSSDYFKCKQYNVSIDTYINAVYRNNETKVNPNIEKLCDNSDYNPEVNQYNGVARRAGQADTTKSGNPVLIENGDIIEYKVTVTNNSSSLPPYYTPKAITGTITFSLPTNTGGHFKIYKINGTGNSSGTYNISSLASGASQTITILAKSNDDSTVPYNYGNIAFSATITSLSNINNITVTNQAGANAVSDYFSVKEYKVPIDCYISKVEHSVNLGNIPKTFDGITRSGIDNASKENNKAYVECGDKVTYTIDIYNTSETGFDSVTSRNSDPYKSPGIINATISLNYTGTKSSFSCDSDGGTKNNDGSITFIDFPAGGKKSVTISYIVDDNTKGATGSVEAILSNVSNINNYSVVNNSQNTKSKDSYIVSEYKVSLNEKISAYNAEMLAYNNAHGFTNNEGKDFTAGNYTSSKPLAVEKHETVQFEVTVKNEYTTGEEENNTMGYGQYKTRARPEFTQYLDYGLEPVSATAILYNANGSENKRLTENNMMNTEIRNDTTNKKKEIRWKVNDPNVILSSGQYIVFTVTVRVTASNLCLDTLAHTSSVKDLTNVNNKSVTSSNTATPTEGSDYVKLKDIIVAGRVWLDGDRDGNNNSREVPKGEKRKVTLAPGATDVEEGTKEFWYIKGSPTMYSDPKCTKVLKFKKPKRAGYKLKGFRGPGVSIIVVNSDGGWNDKGGYSNATDYTCTAIWEAGAEAVSSEATTNETTDENSDDESLEGIKVTLYYYSINPGGKEYSFIPYNLASTTTDENGNYSFGRVSKEGAINTTAKKGYGRYYVQFEYNGIKYKPTEIYGGDASGNTYGQANLIADATEIETDGKNENKITKKGGAEWYQGYGDLPDQSSKSGKVEYINDSNAYEFDDDRNRFDNDYKTIGFNSAYKNENNNIAKGQSLTYDKTGHESKLSESVSDSMNAISFITQDFSKKVENKEENRKELLDMFSYNKNTKQSPETEYLKFINLGLVEREEVDISLEADVQSVRTVINGENMTYEFGKNDADSTSSSYYTQTNAFRLANPYDLGLFKSDFYYRYDEYYKNHGHTDNSTVELDDSSNDLKTFKTNNSELQTEVTYSVKIHNNKINNDEPNLGKDNANIPVETAINEIAIYYDKNFMDPFDDKNEIKTVRSKQKNSTNGILTDYNRSAVRVRYGTESSLGTANAIFKNQYNYSEDKKYGIEISKTPKYKDISADPTELTNLQGTNYGVFYVRGQKLNDLYYTEGGEGILEITMVIDKDSHRNLKGIESGHEFNLIAEVNAYTTKYSNNYRHKGLAGQYAGLIDRDSNPGNLHLQDSTTTKGIEDYANYEDDKYKVGIKLGLLDEPENMPPVDTSSPNKRIISGNVWDDARSNKITEKDGTGVQYIGNGKYSATDTNDKNAAKNPNDTSGKDEKPIENVKVSLVEIIQAGDGKYYEWPAHYTYGDKKGQLIECKTNSEGYYSLDEFVPGYYKVRFDYGYDTSDKCMLYNGQDYKSTKYHDPGYYSEITNASNSKVKYGSDDNICSSTKFDYFDEVRNELNKDKSEAGSDAQDDEIRRLNVNSYSEIMTSNQAQVFSKATAWDKYKGNTNAGEYQDASEYKKKLAKNAHMYADTTIFYVKPENVKSSQIRVTANSLNILGTTPTNEDKQRLDPNTFNENRTFKIANVDFGLEYRPEVAVKLDKDPSMIKLTTSDGKALVELHYTYDKDGKLIIDPKSSKGQENVQFVRNIDKSQQGYAYVNIDSEILEGCKVEVEYQMSATNDSEVDRISENLNDIRYMKLADDKNYQNKVYTTNSTDKKNEEGNYNYNANATASELLAKAYYSGYSFDTINGKEKYNYLTKIKKSYRPDGNPYTSGTEAVSLKGSEYYGMYLGQTYYTGTRGDNDIISTVKVDHILDYIDNDFTFEQKENSTKNKTWVSTTSEELNSLLDWTKVKFEWDQEKKKRLLVDRNDVRFDTDKRSNLAMSANDNKSGGLNPNDDTTSGTGNTLLSRFLKTTKQTGVGNNATGKINVLASKVLSADDIKNSKGLSYENIAEIIQYTTLTGRRTTLPTMNAGVGGIIGNINVEDAIGFPKANDRKKMMEEDEDAAEIITITPPTGLKLEQ